MTGRVVTIGEGLGVLRAPAPGIAHAGSLEIGTGGAEGNVAIGLARLGVDVTWLGRIGRDGLGTRVIRELRAENVHAIGIEDDAATGLIIKEWPSPGRTRVTYYRSGSAGSRLTPADVELADIPSAALLHLTGITPALSTSALEAVRRAIAIAEASGVPISFDVNYRSALWTPDAASAVCAELAAHATVVFAGDDEARLLTGLASDSPAELARAITRGATTEVVIKRGEHGAWALVGGEDFEVAATPVTVVDTVGAGDAFVAGYLAERLAGHPVAERLRVGALAGALACTGAGDWESLPTRADLEREHGSDPVAR